MVESIERQLEFLQTVFHAEVKEQLRNPEGVIWHGEARIGDRVIMMGRAQKDYPARQRMLYVWIDNVDAVYERAPMANTNK